MSAGKIKKRQISFNACGNPKQFELSQKWMDSIHTEVLYGGAKGGGKSFVGVSMIFGDAFMYPETHYFIAREKISDLRKFTVPSIEEVFTGWGIEKSMYNFNGMDNVYTLNNGSKVFLLECRYLPSDEKFERFGSMQMTRGWIEEAGQIVSAAKENLAATVGRWNNDKYNLYPKLLLTCNPSKNFLYTDFYKPQREGTIESHRSFIQALPQDNKKMGKFYYENLERTLSANNKERLLKGNWEYDDDPQRLFDYPNIINSKTNSFVRRTGKKYITADIAFRGSDKFCILVWDGWVVIHSIMIDKCDAKDIENMLKAVAEKFGVPRSNIAYDSDGGGVFLNSYLQGAYAFVNNGSVLNKENYFNLRSQCWYKVSTVFANNGIFFDGIKETHFEIIAEELQHIKTKDEDKDKKLAVISKDDIKKSLGRSPDGADCVMMRAVFDMGEIFEKKLFFKVSTLVDSCFTAAHIENNYDMRALDRSPLYISISIEGGTAAVAGVKIKSITADQKPIFQVVMLDRVESGEDFLDITKITDKIIQLKQLKVKIGGISMTGIESSEAIQRLKAGRIYPHFEKGFGLDEYNTMKEVLYSQRIDLPNQKFFVDSPEGIQEMNQLKAEMGYIEVFKDKTIQAPNGLPKTLTSAISGAVHLATIKAIRKGSRKKLSF